MIEIDPRVGLAVAVGVAERRQERRMNDVERAVDPLQAHHAPELVGEDRTLPSLIARTRSIGSVGGPGMSIGSEPR